MAIEVSTIVARLEMNIANFDKNIRKAEKRLRTLAGATKKTAGRMETLVASLKKVAVLFGIGFGARKAISFVSGLVSKASDFVETINAVEVAVGDASTEIFAFGENAAQALGLSRTALNQTAVMFSSFARRIDSADVAGVFEEYVTRATDFASVMNLDMDEALVKFQAGLAGEVRPLRRFGIDMSENTVKAFALANGIGEAGRQMTENERIQARYGTLMEQTAEFAGDFANTSGELANQQRILTALWENAQQELGTELLPTMKDLIGVVISLIPTVKALGNQGIVAAKNLITMVSPFLSVIKAAQDMSTTFTDGEQKTTLLGTSFGLLTKASTAIGNVLSPVMVMARRVNKGFVDAAGAVSTLTRQQLAMKRSMNASKQPILDVLTAEEQYAEEARSLAASIAIVTQRQMAQIRVLIDSAAEFNNWRQITVDATKETERDIRDSMSSIVDLFEDAPEKIKTSVDEMIANILAQKKMAKAFQTVMRQFAAGGLDALVDEFEKAGPAAVDQAGLLAEDMGKAFNLDVNLRIALGESVDLLTNDFALRQRFNELGLTNAEAYLRGFGNPVPFINPLPTVTSSVERDLLRPGVGSGQVPDVIHAPSRQIRPSGARSSMSIGEMTVNVTGILDPSDPASARRVAVELREQLDRLNAEVA